MSAAWVIRSPLFVDRSETPWTYWGGRRWTTAFSDAYRYSTKSAATLDLKELDVPSARAVLRKKKAPPCPFAAGMCALHGYHHGKEAETLRWGAEQILDDYAVGKIRKRLIPTRLRELLDMVDATDSVAYREFLQKDPSHGVQPPGTGIAFTMECEDL